MANDRTAASSPRDILSFTSPDNENFLHPPTGAVLSIAPLGTLDGASAHATVITTGRYFSSFLSHNLSFHSSQSRFNPLSRTRKLHSSTASASTRPTSPPRTVINIKMSTTVLTQLKAKSAALIKFADDELASASTSVKTIDKKVSRTEEKHDELATGTQSLSASQQDLKAAILFPDIHVAAK
jgi:hypothetical protein